MFIGNSDSKIVHTDFCEYAVVMHPDNLEVFGEIYHAVGQGYCECQYCLGGGRKREIAKRILHDLNSNIRDKCLICDEDRGVQAAHIVPKRFGGTATMPLCPNHHWNYDHNLLTKEEESKLNGGQGGRRCGNPPAPGPEREGENEGDDSVVVITQDFIQRGESGSGGWNRRQLQAIGVPYPPARGWRKRIEGRRVPREDAAEFLLLKGDAGRARRRIS